MEDKEVELLSKTLDIIREDVNHRLDTIDGRISKLDTEYDAVLRSILNLEAQRKAADEVASIFRKRISIFSAVILTVLSVLQIVIPYLHLGR